MLTHSNIPFWERTFRSQRATLPSHLPRLLLPDQNQPRFVRRCPVAQKYIRQFRLLNWKLLPTNSGYARTGWRTIPISAYLGAYLVKLDATMSSFGQLRSYLREHPALVWALGFPFPPTRYGTPFDVESSLPSQRHFTRRLSDLPNEIIQNLLDGQVTQMKNLFGEQFGQVVSFDTKHILAWVRENNPKSFMEHKFDKNKQPAGDSDCKLGCKKRTNQATPSKEGKPLTGNMSVGQFYWGYASGAVATKCDAGEFVLAELTQTFDKGETTYFFPLMNDVERRLGFRPPFGTGDAAFDAFYIYDYFHNNGNNRDGGFAAVPLSKKGSHRTFDEDGLPFCEAGLSMPLKATYTNRTSLVQHQRGRYVCPLVYPERNGHSCPISHPKWEEGGCKLVMPTAQGARIRYQIDRDSSAYQEIYDQRTAVERIFSRAVALGIERPKLRNQQAIANMNTLVYVLINLRTLEEACGGNTSA